MPTQQAVVPEKVVVLGCHFELVLGGGCRPWTSATPAAQDPSTVVDGSSLCACMVLGAKTVSATCCVDQPPQNTDTQTPCARGTAIFHWVRLLLWGSGIKKKVFFCSTTPLSHLPFWLNLSLEVAEKLPAESFYLNTGSADSRGPTGSVDNHKAQCLNLNAHDDRPRYPRPLLQKQNKRAKLFQEAWPVSSWDNNEWSHTWSARAFLSAHKERIMLMIDHEPSRSRVHVHVRIARRKTGRLSARARAKSKSPTTMHHHIHYQ